MRTVVDAVDGGVLFVQTNTLQNPAVLVQTLFDSENVAQVGRVPVYVVQAVDGATHPPPAFPFQTHPEKKALHWAFVKYDAPVA